MGMEPAGRSTARDARVRLLAYTGREDLAERRSEGGQRTRAAGRLPSAFGLLYLGRRAEALAALDQLMPPGEAHLEDLM